MKFSTTIILAMILGLSLACSNGEKQSTPAQQPADNTAPAITPPANINSNTSTAAAPAGVQHYICPNNCAGSGGGTAGACPVCGTAYVHNAAFHNQGNAGGSSPMVQQPQQEAPAQNAAGVYHYICQNGCSGGSGAAGSCPQCGGALAHNQAYHQ
ncbi:MAG: hypothetical protein KDD06_05755 [Phaeodactylibacter sp.]|nr:hypothetical protein [Phaeodactylibacter sp.]MCB9263600.1 hypothetical protein [Lewinellaceae bacterium]MCB9287520.1 hypothetical protein [Lewinellaceae bacterium]